MAKLITTNLVTAKVAERTKYFDTKCPGFYVSITCRGIATFAFKYWNKKLGKQRSVEIGTYDPEGWTVERARSEAQTLSAKVERGENIEQQIAVKKAATATVSQVIDDFIAEVSTPVKKADGEERAQLESWKNVAGFLNREVRPAIGDMAAADVTNNDIARIQAGIALRSVSGARQTRSGMSRLFKFAAEAGRPYSVTSNPVHNLPEVGKEYERTRVLSPEEIRALWWGLDDPKLPCIRSIALAIRFELVSMLRTSEFRRAQRSHIAGFGTDTPVLRVPLKFVKKRRVILQPLNSLAIEIINEATRDHNHDVIFATRSLNTDATLNRNALSHALNGKKDKNGKTKRVGIIEFLSMAHFTPHDLRRTASTLAGDIGFSDAQIAKCLDHSKDRGEDVVEAPSVTGRVYVQSKRLDEKRAVLNGLDAALREIIGSPIHLRQVA